LKRQELRAVAILIGVFLLGAVAGLGGGVAYVRHEARGFSSEPGARMERARLWALSRALDLTDAQRDRIQVILERHRKEREEVWRKVMTDCGEPLEKSKAALDAEIRAVLTPEQLPKFYALATEQREHFYPRYPGRR